MLVVGLCGLNGSGKSTVSEVLKKEGFYYRSLSDAIRDEVAARGEEATRENLIRSAPLLSCIQNIVLPRAVPPFFFPLIETV